MRELARTIGLATLTRPRCQTHSTRREGRRRRDVPQSAKAGLRPMRRKELKKRCRVEIVLASVRVKDYRPGAAGHS